MARDDTVYLTYIDESITLLISYTRNGKQRFMSDVCEAVELLPPLHDAVRSELAR